MALAEPDLAAVSRTVLLLTGGVTMLLAMVMRRGRFCTMGALADWFTMRDSTRLRMWCAAIGVAMVGTQGLAWAGLIRLDDTLYTAPTLVPGAHLLGGLLFGAGMVLAGGCPTRALLRAGSGSLKAWVVLIITGVTAAMTLRGILAPPRAFVTQAWAITLGTPQDLPSMLSAHTALSRDTARGILALLLGGGLIVSALHPPAMRPIKIWGTALMVGAAVVGIWWISGHLGYVPEHPETLIPAYLTTQSGHPEALSLVAPLAHTLDWLTRWTDTHQTLTLGSAAVLGLLTGALVDALLSQTLHKEGFHGLEDTAHHMLGAACMGAGGVTALGCSIGQGLSGIATLSLGSAIALLGIFAGAMAALNWLQWRLGRQP